MGHGSGSESSNADFFSWYPEMTTQETFSVLENHVRMTELLHSPVTSEEVMKYSLRIPIISSVMNMSKNWMAH